MQELLPSSSVSAKGPSMVKLFGFNVSLNFGLACWTLISIACGLGQQVFMPLLLFTFGGSTGVYPVVFICSLLFNFIFWPITFFKAYKDSVKHKENGTKPKRSYFFRGFSSKIIWIGVLDGLNGILTVFASSSSRVPPVLQPIILQSYIIFTLVLSKIILGRSYKRQQIISVLVLFLGILVSLIPIFIQIASGEDLAFQSGAYWGVILFVSTAPAALMNIKEEEVFEENPNYDIALLIAWESLIQVLFVGFCFWADLIPHFGTSTSLRELVTNFENGMSCVFFENSLPGTHCQYCMLFIILFGLAYCGAYYFSAYLMKYASANYNSAVSSVVSPAGTIWWCIFTGVAKWIGAPPTNSTDILYCLLSFVFIIPASWYFKKFDMIEKEKKHEEHAHLRDSIVNSDD
jgi:hypothetical protein